MHKKTNASVASVPWKAAIAVACIAFVIHLPAAWNDFTFDDWIVVARNPAIQEWGNWRLLLFSDYWPDTHSALYRPITLLSFALERFLHGSGPAGFHLVNIALHALVSLLVFLVASEALGPSWAAFFSGILFAVHPIHTEPVSGIVGRAELLAALFCLWAFWIWMRKWRFARLREVSGWRWALALYFLAMLSKENAVVFPALLILGELARDDSQSWRSRLRRALGDPKIWAFAAVAILAFMLRAAALGGIQASVNPDPPIVENPLAREPAGIRTASALANQGRGVVLHLLPAPLIADYSHETLPVRRGGFDRFSLLVAAGVFAVVVAWCRRSLIPLAFWSSWYVVTALPTSNLFVPIGAIFAERLFYLPSIGFCLVIGILAASARGVDTRAWTIPATKGARLVLVSFVSIAAIGSILTWQRLSDWRSDLTLFSDTVRKAPYNVKARLWFGDSLAREGRFLEALAEYDRALAIHPEYAAAAANRLVPLVQLGRYAEAIDAGEKARDLFRKENPILLYNLALAYRGAGNTVLFLDFIQRSLKLEPKNAQAHVQLGMYYFQHALDRAAARAHFQEALRLDPNLPDASNVRRLLNRSENSGK